MFKRTKSIPKKDKLKKFYDSKLSILEICTGDSQNPVYIPITEKINIEELRKSWCFDYYKAKDYFIIETFDVVRFEEEASKGLSDSLPFMEWFPDKDGFTKAYPYGIYIRIPYPSASDSIAPIVNQLQNYLSGKEII